MKQALYICALFAFLLAMPWAARAAFFEALPDMPQAPGLQLLDERSFTYDKPFGRVVTLVSVLDGVTSKDVEAFYRQSLPVLGWAQQPSLDRYVREDEVLRFWFEQEQGAVLLYMTINPLEP